MVLLAKTCYCYQHRAASILIFWHHTSHCSALRSFRKGGLVEGHSRKTVSDEGHWCGAFCTAHGRATGCGRKSKISQSSVGGAIVVAAASCGALSDAMLALHCSAPAVDCTASCTRWDDLGESINCFGSSAILLSSIPWSFKSDYTAFHGLKWMDVPARRALWWRIGMLALAFSDGGMACVSPACLPSSTQV
jgi:hypothetical protein